MAVLAARSGYGPREAKRRFLDAATVDGRGGAGGTGVRYWVCFMVHVIGVNPIQPRDACVQVRRMYEEFFEDCWCWVVEYRPSGRARAPNAESVQKYASSTQAWHNRYFGMLGLGAAQGRLADILRGVARLLPQTPPRVRHGCPPEALVRGLAVTRSGESPESLMVSAALEFGLAALARACEFAIDDERGEVFETSEHLTPEDVTPFERSGVRHARMRMRKRKDLKVLRGKHATVVLAGGGSVFDPVRRLERWLRARRVLGLPADGPLFCWPDGSPLTTRQVRAEVRAAMQAAGLPPLLYGGHSLRIGGASAALAAGVPPAMIRLMGRWSSDVYEIYCRMSEQAALGVGLALASTEVDTFEGFHQEHFELLPGELDLQGGVEDVVR